MNELPLRDIHLPEAVSWWPPAPGWWVLAAALLMALLGGSYLWYRGREQRALLRAVLAELEHLSAAQHAGYEPQQLLRELSVLVRRVALSLYPRAEVAALTGSEWLQFLDRTAGGPLFTRGPARHLATAPYRAASEVDLPAVLAVVKAWALQVCEQHQGRRA